ncbi:MAG: hypothetical protein P8Y48_19155 [Novosphingobium sp.]
MPIALRVVTQEQYDAWATAAQDDLDTANEQLMAAIAADKKTAQVRSLDEITVAGN